MGKEKETFWIKNVKKIYKIKEPTSKYTVEEINQIGKVDFLLSTAYLAIDFIILLLAWFFLDRKVFLSIALISLVFGIFLLAIYTSTQITKLMAYNAGVNQIVSNKMIKKDVKKSFIAAIILFIFLCMLTFLIEKSLNTKDIIGSILWSFVAGTNMYLVRLNIMRKSFEEVNID
ncbi:hypothetical protein BG262_07065 [Floricoccus penangensis]|uniref:DUF3278 domain-containing protein n=1 Tax=Floricoccus penangensis TaxID=1859475 RepID=A0A9Q5P021_9LACT|nr:DUF3278 domain-containing protein [Floricoccus penangensis]OFI45752.1 hypothetical protein BG262_07065 [Floricoccus penangensis]